MKAGQILEVIADCPQSFRSVPEEVVKHGYELMNKEKVGRDLFFKIRVQR